MGTALVRVPKAVASSRHVPEHVEPYCTVPVDGGAQDALQINVCLCATMRCLRAVEIDACKSGSTPMSLIHPLVHEMDQHGVCKDGIWRIRTPGTPDRFLRLYKGSKNTAFDTHVRLGVQMLGHFLEASAVAAAVDVRVGLRCARQRDTGQAEGAAGMARARRDASAA